MSLFNGKLAETVSASLLADPLGLYRAKRSPTVNTTALLVRSTRRMRRANCAAVEAGVDWFFSVNEVYCLELSQLHNFLLHLGGTKSCSVWVDASGYHRKPYNPGACQIYARCKAKIETRYRDFAPLVVSTYYLVEHGIRSTRTRTGGLASESYLRFDKLEQPRQA